MTRPADSIRQSMRLPDFSPEMLPPGRSWCRNSSSGFRARCCTRIRSRTHLTRSWRRIGQRRL